jgi:hypothetical protein
MSKCGRSIQSSTHIASARTSSAAEGVVDVTRAIGTDRDAGAGKGRSDTEGRVRRDVGALGAGKGGSNPEGGVGGCVRAFGTGMRWSNPEWRVRGSLGTAALREIDTAFVLREVDRLCHREPGVALLREVDCLRHRGCAASLREVDRLRRGQDATLLREIDTNSRLRHLGREDGVPYHTIHDATLRGGREDGVPYHTVHDTTLRSGREDRVPYHTIHDATSRCIEAALLLGLDGTPVLGLRAKRTAVLRMGGTILRVGSAILRVGGAILGVGLGRRAEVQQA